MCVFGPNIRTVFSLLRHVPENFEELHVGSGLHGDAYRLCVYPWTERSDFTQAENSSDSFGKVVLFEMDSFCPLSLFYFSFFSLLTIIKAKYFEISESFAHSEPRLLYIRPNSPQKSRIKRCPWLKTRMFLFFVLNAGLLVRTYPVCAQHFVKLWN